jgi:ABC-type uncharacterized transport system auxiliary subunit
MTDRTRKENRMIKPGTWIRFGLLLLFPVLLAACLGSTTPPQPVYYYTLNYEPPATQQLHHLPCTLRVERFSVSPPYNSQHIIYARDDLQRNAYAYNQWIVSPGELLPFFLARDLRRSNGFRAVLTPDATLPATHSLYGWVEEFAELDSASQWQASAIIHVTLIANLENDPTLKILLQKRYKALEPCKGKTPEALARAMSIAVADISKRVCGDIHDRLSSVGALTY